jgi:sugar phosphate isomerase/epimerase
MKTIQSFLLLLGVVLMVSCGSSDKKTVENVEKNIGLQLYSLRDAINDENVGILPVLAEVGAMGYKYVETANYFDGTIYGMSPEEFKAELEKVGLYALSTHTSRGLASNPSETNWDDTWAWWDKNIATHKAAGMKYVVVPSMPTPATLADLQIWCDYYNEIGKRCQAAGMKFGYHNHAFEFEKNYEHEGAKITMFDYMIQNTNPELVFFQLDVYWAVMGKRSPVDLFKKYPGRFEVLHIKDDRELGESGMVGFDAIFKNIETAGTKYLIIEVERYSGIPPIESVKQSLGYLNLAPFVRADYSK